MPNSKSDSKTGPAVDTDDEVYQRYLQKEPTDLQRRFADWIIDVVGYDPEAAEDLTEAFREGVRLGVALRMVFQGSPQNQSVLEARRVAREKQLAELKARPKKSTRKPKAVEEPEDIEEEEEEEEEAPKPAPKRTRRKSAPVVEEPEDIEEEEEEEEEEEAPKPAPKRTRRKPKVVEEPEDDEEEEEAPKPAPKRTRRKSAVKADAAPDDDDAPVAPRPRRTRKPLVAAPF